MSLSREEQLDLVARNIGEWPDSSVELWAYFYGDVFLTDMQTNDSYLKHMSHTNPPKHFFTRSEVEAKQREITGEPDDKDAPEWANWKAQDENGLWGWFKNKQTPVLGVWADFEDAVGETFAARKGEVLGDWRDTLKQVEREEKEVAKFIYGKKYQHEGCGWKGLFIGFYPEKNDIGVFASDTEAYFALLSEMKPALSERDEFVRQVLYCFDEKYADQPTPDCTVRLSEMIFDAIAEGRLKAPEVKK